MGFWLSTKSSARTVFLVIFSSLFLVLLRGCTALLLHKVGWGVEKRITLPITHLAIIMDGNRRWAKSLGLPTWQGHREGASAVERTVKFCLGRGIKILSLYAFSLENFKREAQEQETIFRMMGEVLEHWPAAFNSENVRVRFVGNRSLFPSQVIQVVDKLEQTTATNSGLLVNIMFCYGGQQEIVAAAKIMAQKVQSGALQLDAIDEQSFTGLTWTGNIPPPDLIFRTGKRARLSNFMTLFSAYSEIYFSDLYWPEVQEQHLEQICAQFEECTRTFGY
jgi:undecaprenyl diphosphate synthase